jgi:ubiquinone/menaquinone biosynthesis C-methylase UbiE
MAASFAEHYRDFYDPTDKAHLAWRAAGAKEKADNVLAMWNRVDGPQHPTVADIGCGDGAIAAALSRSGFYERLDGFDVSDSGVAIAQSRTIPSASFAIYDGARIPVEGGSYDLAVLSHVVEHVEEPRAVIREAARIARWVVIEVPMEHNLRHLGDFRWTDTGHVNFYDTALIRQLVQSCGLTVHAEATTNPSKPEPAAMRSKGMARWAVKQGLLKSVPPLAIGVFTYHRVLIASA